MHHAGFIYYNLHDARNHENQIAIILYRPSRMFQLYQTLSQSFTDQAGCFSCIKHCHNPLQPSRMFQLYQTLSQSFTDQAECFSCIKHCHNPLQTKQDVSAVSNIATILYRPTRMFQLYQTLL